jgi:hypothetical protein
MGTGSAGNDPRLARIVAASSGQQTREEDVDKLLAECATPLIERLLRAAAVRRALPATDLPDLAGELRLRVLRRLRRAVEDPRADPLPDVEDYVHTAVYYAVDDHLHRGDPLRTRLAQRVRYVLTHTRGLAIWNRNPAVCGFEEWATGRLPVPVAPPERLPISTTTDIRRLRATVEQALRRSGGPVELSALVEALADAAGLTREPFLPTANLVAKSDDLDPLARLESREYLRRSWAEIVALPARQRRALLLQLRLGDGDSVTRLLPVLGIVTIEEVATALEMPLADLLLLWNELPLEDQRIAAMLGIKRQQVINLRKSARERLARRLGRPR